METLPIPTSAAEMARIMDQFHEWHDNNKPSVPSFDRIGAALQLDTAQVLKTGLEVTFYVARPADRSESYLLCAYYAATWRGATYRGDVGLSNRGYHADTANGFVCWDSSRYCDKLPDGCRQLIAARVTAAVLESGVLLADMETEKAAYSAYYAAASEIYKAKSALELAARYEERGV